MVNVLSIRGMKELMAEAAENNNMDELEAMYRCLIGKIVDSRHEITDAEGMDALTAIRDAFIEEKAAMLGRYEEELEITAEDALEWQYGNDYHKFVK
jgi:hypothetical protein